VTQYRKILLGGIGIGSVVAVVCVVTALKPKAPRTITVEVASVRSLARAPSSASEQEVLMRVRNGTSKEMCMLTCEVQINGPYGWTCESCDSTIWAQTVEPNTVRLVPLRMVKRDAPRRLRVTLCPVYHKNLVKETIRDAHDWAYWHLKFPNRRLEHEMLSSTKDFSQVVSEAFCDAK